MTADFVFQGANPLIIVAATSTTRLLSSALAQLAGANAHLCCTLSAMGQLGAANSIVQVIAMSALLQRQMLAPVAGLQQADTGPLRPQIQAQAPNARGALALAAGAPGLAGAVRVALD